jgi:hypothetical protein
MTAGGPKLEDQLRHPPPAGAGTEIDFSTFALPVASKL